MTTKDQLLHMALHALQCPTFTTREARADLAGKIEGALAASTGEAAQEAREAPCSAPAAPRPAALQQLIAHAEGRLPHAGNGMCPDAVEGHDARDPECPVCRALDAVAAPQVAATPADDLTPPPEVLEWAAQNDLDKALRSIKSWSEYITELEGDSPELAIDRLAFMIAGEGGYREKIAAAPEVAAPQAEPDGWMKFDPLNPPPDGLYWAMVSEPETDCDVDDYGRTVGWHTGETIRRVAMLHFDGVDDDGPNFAEVNDWELGKWNGECWVTHLMPVVIPTVPDADRAAQAACTGRASHD